MRLHELRRALARPERAPLDRLVEVDETHAGGTGEAGVSGRRSVRKALVVIAVELRDARGFGRVRMRRVLDAAVRPGGGPRSVTLDRADVGAGCPLIRFPLDDPEDAADDAAHVAELAADVVAADAAADAFVAGRADRSEVVGSRPGWRR